MSLERMSGGEYDENDLRDFVANLDQEAKNALDTTLNNEGAGFTTDTIVNKPEVYWKNTENKADLIRQFKWLRNATNANERATIAKRIVELLTE